MAIRYTQPQGGPFQLDSGNPLTRSAHVLIVGSSPVNIVSGKALVTVGPAAKATVKPGIADAFRKNSYRKTEVLSAIGTANFVEVWQGYPRAFGSAGSAGESGFVTGSNLNQTGIYLNGRPGGTTWGAVCDWNGGIFNTTSEVLPLDVLTTLLVARYQDRMELWRDGRLVATFPQSPTNYPAQNFIIGSFIEDTGYWASSSDTVLACRFLASWSVQNIKSFFANPWQVIKSPQRAMFAAAAGGTATYSYTSTGGFVFSGAAPGVRSATKAAAGGLQLSGTAPQARGVSKAPAGGILLSGTAPQTRGRAVAPAGGLTLSGASSIVRSIARATTGGLKFAGAATLSVTAQVQARVITPVGGLLLAGAAAVSRATSRAVSGGITFSGHAVKTAGAAGALLASLLPIFRRRRR